MTQTHKIWFFHVSDPTTLPRSVPVSVNHDDFDFEAFEPTFKNRLEELGYKTACLSLWELKEPLQIDQMLPSGIPLEAIATRLGKDASIHPFVTTRESESGPVCVVVESGGIQGAATGATKGHHDQGILNELNTWTERPHPLRSRETRRVLQNTSRGWQDF
ncbi:hypothetical protein BJ138DRAFT_117990 [Hygrophoropsis aurantiaca]|uniref:Uncharacterized protein n=1 Tax=Hygrophoropsis aurantiaca TaxID=72124 RepID=A0ACB7ZS97_9AGAM|nr:hypothetical protein BJ138DRAFT_117990 [Hygrophoropsis aurantiaca]